MRALKRIFATTSKTINPTLDPVAIGLRHAKGRPIEAPFSSLEVRLVDGCQKVGATQMRRNIGQLQFRHGAAGFYRA